MKLGSNGGILKNRLLMFYFLTVVPLDTCYMRSTSRQTSRTGSFPSCGYGGESPVQSLNNVVGSDTIFNVHWENHDISAFPQYHPTILAVSFCFIEQSSSITVLVFSRVAFLLS